IALPYDHLPSLRNRRPRPCEDLRTERLPAPGVGPGRVVVDQRLAQLLFARHDQLTVRRLPALVQSRIEEISAIEVPAFGWPPRVCIAPDLHVAQGAPAHRRLVELGDAQQLAAHRATVAVPARHDFHLLAHPMLALVTLRNETAAYHRPQAARAGSPFLGGAKLRLQSAGRKPGRARSMVHALPAPRLRPNTLAMAS